MYALMGSGVYSSSGVIPYPLGSSSVETFALPKMV